MPVAERYSRQVLFAGIGEEGQSRITQARVAVIGVGALGTVIANNLARAGVGYLRLVDRDFVELSNLQRQTLFDENDIVENLPKAVAAARHLEKVNSEIILDPVVSDVNAVNIEQLLDGVDLVVDGTDNFETRFLINDIAVKRQLPWIYGAVLGSYGMTMNIIPGESPCFNCLVKDLPEPGVHQTCSSAGVLNMITGIIACYESAEAVKILVKSPQIRKTVQYIDIWSNYSNSIALERDLNCPTCGQGQFRFLQGGVGSAATVLCGQNSIQLVPPRTQKLDLPRLAAKLEPLGKVTINKFLLRFTRDDIEMTVFPDGRAIFKNVETESKAKSLYAEFIGL